MFENEYGLILNAAKNDIRELFNQSMPAIAAGITDEMICEAGLICFWSNLKQVDSVMSPVYAVKAVQERYFKVETNRVTVSEETKKRLMDEIGLTEADFE